MPWDGHGNFNRTSGVYTGADVWEQSRAAGRNVRSDDFDSHDEDLAEGLENCLARDGQNQPTANLPMGGKRHLNISNGQARNQYPSIAQIQDRSLTFIPASGVGGTADAITLTPSPVITAYVAGQTFTFEAEFDSTGNVTVNVSSLGAKAVYVDESQAGSEAIINGRVYDIIYDGTNFQLKGSVISAGSVVSGVLNAARIPNPGPSFIPATGVAGTGNAITLTPSPAIGAYAAGQMFTFLVKSGNTGNVTVNVSSLGAKSLGMASGEIPPDVLTADDVITIIYTGTIFHLLSISPGTAAKKSTGTASGEVALLSTGGKWTSGLIPDLDADKVASGALSTDRIPNLNASKITAGTLSSDRLPQVPQSKGGYTEYETRTSGDDHQIRFKTAENTWSAWITYETASEDCFLPGTPVLMADGGWKPVERIKIGDWVLSPMGPRQVVALDTGRTQPRVEIYVRKNGERHALRCTVNHPIMALPRRTVSARSGPRSKPTTGHVPAHYRQCGQPGDVVAGE